MSFPCSNPWCTSHAGVHQRAKTTTHPAWPSKNTSASKGTQCEVIRNQRGDLLMPGDVVRDSEGKPYMVLSMDEKGSVEFYRIGRNIDSKNRLFNLPVHLVSFVKFQFVHTYNGFDMVSKSSLLV